MSADEILAAARACLGTPFLHQGRIPGVALDCAGLVVAVAQSLGAEYVDRTGYSRAPSHGQLQCALDEQPCLERVAAMDRQPGDVLLIRFAGDPQHLAILAGETIIHSYASVGRVCEHRLSSVWAARIVCAYRFKGLV